MAQMSEFDLVVRNGRVATALEVFAADIGVRGGVIAAIARDLPKGVRDIDADGCWVLPGGIDSHCHIEQLSGMGVMCADDFYSGTVAAAFGGTTTVIPFAAQHRGMAVPEVLADYSARAAAKSVIDYGFHLIVANPDERTLTLDLPEVIRSGITSIKLFLTYERMRVDDRVMLAVMDVARREGAMVMVHAENHEMIQHRVASLLEQGCTAPKYHAVAHDALAEVEAVTRAITAARFMATRLMIVHVSAAETVDVVRRAKAQSPLILAESCPQYLFLSEADLDRPGLEGAKFCCSPPPRDAVSQRAVWKGFMDGTLDVYSSDHAPYRFDETGKLPKGEATTFKEMANGLPGLELRLPLLFSHGVMGGLISINQFVALSAANHARIYGLEGRKGTVAVGTDADLAIWNPARRTVVRADMLHDRTGYTPYEGMNLMGWPETVISRGRVIVENGQLHAEPGSGRYLARDKLSWDAPI